MQLSPRMIAFCRDPKKVAEMRKILETPIMVEAREIMADSSPITMTPVAEDITPHFSNIVLGMARGWSRYHNMFAYFGMHFEVPQGDEEAALRLDPEE